MEKIKFEEVQSLLDSGKKPEEVFDFVDSSRYGWRLCRLNGKWNYIDENNKLLFDEWFTKVRIGEYQEYTFDDRGKLNACECLIDLNKYIKTCYL